MASLDWWRGTHLGWCCGNSNHAVSVKPKRVRRRNRARHAEIAAKEIFDATSVPHHETWGDRWRESRPFDMNDDNNCPSNEVWRILVEDQEGYRDVDFTGVYTTESENDRAR